jgi:hypothetical protein
VNVYVKLGLILAIVLSLAGSVVWVKSEYDQAITAAKESERAKTLLETARRDNEQLAQARAEIDRLRAKVVVQEAEHQQRMVEMDQKATRELANERKRRDDFIGDVAAGRIRLFDPAARRADAECPSGGVETEAKDIATGRVGNGARGAELSGALASFLGSEANRADQVVHKVAYLQGVIREYMKVCNVE